METYVCSTLLVKVQKLHKLKYRKNVNATVDQVRLTDLINRSSDNQPDDNTL